MDREKKHIFSSLEKKAFIDVLKKYSSIIENKDTDGVTLRNKNEAWTKITNEFNASPHSSIQSTKQQLRRLWMNLKQRQRSALTKERQHRMATGGGPSTSDAIIDPDIAQVAPALFVSVDNVQDSDSVLDVSNTEVVEDIEIQSQDAQFPIIIPTLNSPDINNPQSPQASSSNPAIIIPPPPICNPQNETLTLPTQRQKYNVLEKEYEARQKRANELHNVEMLILQQKLRKATAEADLAELLLNKQQHLPDYKEQKLAEGIKTSKSKNDCYNLKIKFRREPT